ncbi:MAG: hypothetical protein WAN51_13945 [Alphaproteobacteria bacterium]
MKDFEIQHAAAELIMRHGANALAVAREWAEKLSGSRDKAAFKAALRVLTAHPY